MSDMSETVETDNTIILAGRVIQFIPPTQGQVEQMVRIARSTQRGGDDAPSDFWVKQIGRIGDLLEQMIAEGDRETVEDLYVAGKLDHTTLVAAILTKVRENAEKSEDKAIAKAKKVTGARVQRK
jgi:hypothetical protein